MKKGLALLLLTGYLFTQVQAQHKPKQETAEERDKRMTWWRNDRFGMFIHWGYMLNSAVITGGITRK
ncbi:alpha-L-fucosidase [Niabella hibiscisoli]|uniref:alpha-L-fucosidase n=1 Tax=Niabella hibiscisoli TaxID=1825928 RepID=UPI0021D43E91|nr:alpha-L-fucosidase [Niabella hibiscisoli]